MKYLPEKSLTIQQQRKGLNQALWLQKTTRPYWAFWNFWCVCVCVYDFFRRLTFLKIFKSFWFLKRSLSSKIWNPLLQSCCLYGRSLEWSEQKQSAPYLCGDHTCVISWSPWFIHQEGMQVLSLEPSAPQIRAIPSLYHLAASLLGAHYQVESSFPNKTYATHQTPRELGKLQGSSGAKRSSVSDPLFSFIISC